MEQKDYLLREIEKIGVMLRGIAERILGMKQAFRETPVQRFAAARELLITQSGIDLDELMSSDPGQFPRLLPKEKGFNADNLETLAAILIELGQDEKETKKCTQKAIELLEYIDLSEKSFSLARQEKIEAIRKLLN
jgi:hypothetical protein